MGKLCPVDHCHPQCFQNGLHNFVRKITFIKICIYKLKKMVLMKFWCMDHENIQFFHKSYSNWIHWFFFFFFLSIHFFSELFCNVSWQQHLVIALITVIISLNFFFMKKFFLLKRKKPKKLFPISKADTYACALLVKMVEIPSTKNYLSAACLMMIHISCGPLFEKTCPCLI